MITKQAPFSTFQGYFCSALQRKTEGSIDELRIIKTRTDTSETKNTNGGGDKKTR